jgi:hypothetical protein
MNLVLLKKIIFPPLWRNQKFIIADTLAVLMQHTNSAVPLEALQIPWQR